MKKYVVAIFLMLLGIGAAHPPKVLANNVYNPSVIFSEIFPGNPSPNAAQEFIELYNNSTTVIDLSGWRLQYVSATKTDWSSPTRNIALTGSLEPGSYYLLASTGYLTAQAQLTFSATLSQTGGHLRLLDGGSNQQDLIGWGNAAMPLGYAAFAPAAGNSLSRLSNAQGFNLTGDNATDFIETTQGTPGATNIINSPAADPDPSTTGSSSTTITTPEPAPVANAYPAILISELLSNPGAPKTDAQDEFIELYNPGADDVDLHGYILVTGNNDSYKYAIKNVTITAGSYSMFYSRDTKLVLSNNGSRAQLLAPDGSQMDETASFGAAPDNHAWIFANGAWTWTITPTPGQANIFTAPVKLAAKPPAASSKSASAGAKRSGATAKTSKENSSKKSTTSASTAKAASTTSGLSPNPNVVHPLVLAGVGAGAVGYAAYEYRNDLANRFYQLRRYRAARATARAAIKKP